MSKNIRRWLIVFFSSLLPLPIFFLVWPNTEPPSSSQLEFHFSKPLNPGASLFEPNKEGHPKVVSNGLNNLPTSINDIEIDGSLNADEAGNLVINAEVRRLFDFFLNTEGEESLTQIISRLNDYFRSHLPATAAAQAQQLLGNYIALRKAADELPSYAENADANGAFSVASLKKQKEEIKSLRLQFLSPDVDTAFFSEDDHYDDYTFEKMEIIQNQALTAQARATKLAALESNLPDALRESMREVSIYSNLKALTDEWLAKSGSAMELRQIRESIVGPQAADRLERLDQERQVWNQRILSWLQERRLILQNDALPLQEKNAQLRTLRQSRFNNEEIARVETLEGISGN